MASSRATQLSTLERIVHDKFTDDRIGELLDELEPYAASLPYDADDACLVRVARRDWEKARRIPTRPRRRAREGGCRGVPGLGRARARRETSRRSARRSSAMLELTLRKVECFAPYDDPTTSSSTTSRRACAPSTSTRVFAVLQPGLTSLVDEHAADDGDELLRGSFAIDKQDALSREIIAAFGVDWEAFRLDLTVHPFAGPLRLRTTSG